MFLAPNKCKGLIQDCGKNPYILKRHNPIGLNSAAQVGALIHGKINIARTFELSINEFETVAWLY